MHICAPFFKRICIYYIHVYKKYVEQMKLSLVGNKYPTFYVHIKGVLFLFIYCYYSFYASLFVLGPIHLFIKKRWMMPKHTLNPCYNGRKGVHYKPKTCITKLEVCMGNTKMCHNTINHILDREKGS